MSFNATTSKFSDFVRGLPAATEADLDAGNNMPVVSASDVKKMGGENVAKASDVNGDTAIIELVAISANYTYYPYEIIGGKKYKCKVTRTDGKAATCFLKTSGGTTQATVVDTLPNVAFGVVESDFEFTASADAHYIAVYSNVNDIHLSFEIYSDKGMAKNSYVEAIDERLAEIENIVDGNFENIDITAGSPFTFYPYEMKAGVTYKACVKRLSIAKGTCQFRATRSEDTSSASVIVSLPNLSYEAEETSFYFTPNEDAHYIAAFCSANGMKVSFEISSNEGLSKKKLSKCVVNNLIQHNNVNSTSTYRFPFGEVPRGAKIIDFSFQASAAGSTKMGIWKYENNSLTLMEVKELTATAKAEIVHVASLENFVAPYAMMFSFINTSGVTGCVGWHTTTGHQLSIAASGYTEVGSVIPFNKIGSTTGSECLRIIYEDDFDSGDVSILEVGCRKKIKSIQEAVLIANDGDFINVDQGVYKEQVNAWGKNVHIIGMDKYNCILEDDSGYYYTPPLEISAGSVCNMTIRETATNPPPEADTTIIPGTGLTAKNMAYCIHMDFEGNGAGDVVIDNCIMWNANRPCIGSGLHANKKMEVRNCVMYSGVADEGKSRGAFYCHANADGVSGQKLVVDNCDISCDDPTAILLRGYAGGEMVLQCSRNIVWSAINGSQNSCVDQNFGTGIALKGNSFGNNVEILNAESAN